MRSTILAAGLASLLLLGGCKDKKEVAAKGTPTTKSVQFDETRDRTLSNKLAQFSDGHFYNKSSITLGDKKVFIDYNSYSDFDFDIENVNDGSIIAEISIVPYNGGGIAKFSVVSQFYTITDPKVRDRAYELVVQSLDKAIELQEREIQAQEKEIKEVTAELYASFQ